MVGLNYLTLQKGSSLTYFCENEDDEDVRAQSSAELMTLVAEHPRFVVLACYLQINKIKL